MIDTGIGTAAPALVGSRIVTRAFFDGAPAPAKHGTQVASVPSGEGRLVGATIYGANVFGQDEALGLASGADALVRALDWMAQAQIRFVNLALAGPYNKLLDLAVARAATRGLILVSAVGNDGPDAAPMYPAGFEGSSPSPRSTRRGGSIAMRCAATMWTSPPPASTCWSARQTAAAS